MSQSGRKVTLLLLDGTGTFVHKKFKSFAVHIQLSVKALAPMQVSVFSLLLITCVSLSINHCCDPPPWQP